MNNLMTLELPLLSNEVSIFPLNSKLRSSLDKLKEISNDILLLTTEIEIKYPDLYKHLDETPVTFSEVSEIEITISELENYRETLEMQLCNHFNTHELNLSDLFK